MRIENALKARDRLKTRVADIFATAVLCGMTSGEINDAIAAARAELPARLPQWVFAYVDGYRAAMQDRLYSDCLVFGGYVDGVFYSTHSSRPDYYGKHGINPRAYADDGIVSARGHYWRESIQWRGGIYNRGEVRPYFIGESK